MGGYEAVKDLLKVVQQVDNVEVQRALIAVSSEATRLEAENQDLRKRVAELEEALAFKGKLKREGDYLLNDADGEDDRPYCMHCWEADRKPVHLFENNETSWRCRQCDGVTRKPGHPRFGPPIRRNIPTV